MSLLETIVTPLGRLLINKRAGDQYSVANAPQLSNNYSFPLTSTSFSSGEPIPKRHAGEGLGDNISPALAWYDQPCGTVQYLIIMEDTDVPLNRPIIHLAALFPYTVKILEEGELNFPNDTIRFIPTRKGRQGYFGPRALPGHGTHKYGFHLYSLDAVIPETTIINNMEDLLRETNGHVLASAYYEGTQKN
jgi:phosphatidylethanolamine-binding protein (PEBP) family uncharacterized protein